MSNVAKLEEKIKELQAQIEAEREKGKSSLRAEFEKQLEEYQLTIFDVFPEFSKSSDGARVSRKARKTSGVAVSKKERAEVQPKYKNPKGIEVWSGRGRTPKWIVAICDELGITIEQFKKDKRFLIIH